MASMTITEALAELKTTGKRLEKKRQFVCENLCRPEGMKDPLAKDGGSEQVVASELQAISDLETKQIAIRRAISTANAATQVTINGDTKSIADWLTFRRDVAPGVQQFYGRVGQHLNHYRKEAQKHGVAMGAAGQVAQPHDVVVNVSEAEFAKRAEALEAALGQLDGQLSLKNATTFVEV